MEGTLRTYVLKVQHRASADLSSVCCGDQAYLDALPLVDGPLNNLLYMLDVADPFFYARPPYFKSNVDAYEIHYGSEQFGQLLALTPGLSESGATAEFEVDGAFGGGGAR